MTEQQQPDQSITHIGISPALGAWREQGIYWWRGARNHHVPVSEMIKAYHEAADLRAALHAAGVELGEVKRQLAEMRSLRLADLAEGFEDHQRIQKLARENAELMERNAALKEELDEINIDEADGDKILNEREEFDDVESYVDLAREAVRLADEVQDLMKTNASQAERISRQAEALRLRGAHFSESYYGYAEPAGAFTVGVDPAPFTDLTVEWTGYRGVPTAGVGALIKSEPPPVKCTPWKGMAFNPMWFDEPAGPHTRGERACILTSYAEVAKERDALRVKVKALEAQHAVKDDTIERLGTIIRWQNSDVAYLRDKINEPIRLTVSRTARAASGPGDWSTADVEATASHAGQTATVTLP